MYDFDVKFDRNGNVISVSEKDPGTKFQEASIQEMKAENAVFSLASIGQTLLFNELANRSKKADNALKDLYDKI